MVIRLLNARTLAVVSRAVASNRHIVALVVFISFVLVASIRASGVPATDLFTEDLATGEFASAKLLGEPVDVVNEITRAVREPGAAAEPTAIARAEPVPNEVVPLATAPLGSEDLAPFPTDSTSSDTSDTQETAPAIEVPATVTSGPSAQPTALVGTTSPEPVAQLDVPTVPSTSEPLAAAPTTQPTLAPTVQSTVPAESVVARPVAADSPKPNLTEPWCTIEVRADDGVIVWEDAGRTAVFRRNDSWFHTPADDARAVLITGPVRTSDDYVLRLWDDEAVSRDVVCARIVVPAALAPTTTTRPASTTAQPTTTTTTTTVAPVDPGRFPTPIGIPGGRVQMGFNVDLWGQDRTAYWNELEAVPGNGRLIAHEFKSFSKAINMSLFRWHMDQGRDLLLTWNGTDATAILNGSQDEWIREHARELKTLPRTVMLRFWHEPDVSYKGHWIDGDPQQFIDSWVYVRSLFVEEGAIDNIEWVWCPTAWNWEHQGARFYPGDANVDWICADGYSGWDHNKPLPPVEDAYTAFQAWADQHPTKPILIAEFGATERGPGERAEWVRGIPAWVNASPNIRAVVYFDYDRRPNGEDYDWRLRTESDAWQAMKDVLSSRPFG